MIKKLDFIQDYKNFKYKTVKLGVPTVVEASVIVYDTINYLFKHISYIKDNQSKNKLIFSRSNYADKIKDKDLNLEEKRDILGMIGELSDTDKKSLIEEVLASVNYNFIVTPKEVDFVIDKLSMIIGDGINKCLHDIQVIKISKKCKVGKKIFYILDKIIYNILRR